VARSSGVSRLALICALAAALVPGAAASGAGPAARLAFLRGEAGTYFVNLDGTALRRAPLPRRANVLDWSDDGRKVVFEVRGPTSRLYVARGDGTQRVLVRAGPYSCFEADWNPAGTRVVFLENEDCGGWANLFVVNADGSRRRRIVRDQGFAPTWSPSGGRILFKDYFLWIVRPDGRGRRRIPKAVPMFPTGFGDKPTVAWSRTGRQVFFIGSGGGLVVVGKDGGGLRRLTPDGMLVTSFQLSPSGNELALSASPRGRNSDEEIYVLAADGTGLSALTDNRAIPDRHPSWSPDGREIAFAGEGGIHIVYAAGGPSRRVTSNPGDSFPRWVPLRSD
jgi:Tol biopolymer transport system component